MAPATVQVTGAAPTCELRSADGTVIATGQAVTGFTNTTGQLVSVWLNIDTSTPPGGGAALTPGKYILVFTWYILGSDGITRRQRPSAILVVVA